MKVLLVLLVVLSMSSLANATIVWDRWSPLSVTESITGISNGDYQYEYSLVNVDTSPLWGFAIYTNFVTQAESTFDVYPSWGYGTDLIDDADLAVRAAEGKGFIYTHGKKKAVVPEDNLVAALQEELVRMSHR